MGSSSTTTQRADPYAPAQPFINQGLRDAGELYQRGGFTQLPYQGDMVADRDPLSMAAYNASGGVANQALGYAGDAAGALSRAMSPSMSPYIQGVIGNTIDSIMPGLNSSFAGSGMTGSGLHAQNLAKGLSSGVAGVLDNAWQQGQNRALTAAGMVPTINNAAYGAIDFLNNQGTANQKQSQMEINADILRDQQTRNAELNAIQDYLALTSGVGSTFGVQSSRTSKSPGILGVLGLGLQIPGLFE